MLERRVDVNQKGKGRERLNGTKKEVPRKRRSEEWNFWKGFMQYETWENKLDHSI